jgi:hypothetical protein
MGLEGGSEGVVTAAELNEAAYMEALAASPALFRDTFLQRGKQLQFGADRWAGVATAQHACISAAAFLLHWRSCQPVCCAASLLPKHYFPLLAHCAAGM